MSFTSNSFALLAEDGDDVPQVQAPKKAAAPAVAPQQAAKPAPKATRGDYPTRGAPRKVYQGDREVNTEGPTTGEESKEARSASYGARGGRGGGGGRGGARGGRGDSNPRSNGGTYLGGDRPRRENGGGRPFDKHSQTGHKDSEKAEEKGWGAEEGKKELEAEVEGEADAKADVAAVPTTPKEPRAPIVEEEEDNTQTYDEYLAAQAAKKLAVGGSLPEARVANEGADESQWKDAVKLLRKGEAEEDWFLGTKKTDAPKARKQKEAKTYLEIDATFKPPRRDGPPREGGRGRGGRGRGEGRGRGGRGRGEGAPRGAPRSSAPAVNVDDAAAFPTLA